MSQSNKQDRSPSQDQRYSCVDIVRGYGAVSVLLTHWVLMVSIASAGQQMTMWDNGIRIVRHVLQVIFGAAYTHLAVIAFIVVSGFCIHLPLARSPYLWSQPHFWRAYARRRAIRILPLYWGACALGVGALAIGNAQPALVPPFVSDRFDWGRFLAKFACLDAFLPAGEVAGNGVGNIPLVTVATEMWLYAAYPFMVLVQRLSGWKGLFVLAGMLYLAPNLFLAFGYSARPVSGLFFTLLLYWLMGAYAAELFVRGHENTMVNWKKLCGRTGLLALLFLLGMLFRQEGIYFKGLYRVNELLFALLVAHVLLGWMLAESQRRYRPTRMGLSLAWLGEWSYSLYAIHTPCMVLAIMLVKGMAMTGGIVEGVIPLVVVIPFALLTFTVIEKPSHAYARYGVMRIALWRKRGGV